MTTLLRITKYESYIVILDRGEKMGWGWIRERGWKGEWWAQGHEDHQRRSKTNICKRMTRPTFLILQIGKNIIYIVQLSDRQTYAIIQSETLGHIEIITRTYTYLCNTTKLSIFLTNHSSRLFLVISFELLWNGNRTKVRMEKGLNE